MKAKEGLKTGNRTMATWEEKFVRFVAERWVFQGTDPHDFKPRIFLMGLGEDFISPLLEKHKHHGAVYSGYLGDRLVGYIRVPPGTVILEGIMRSLAFTRVDTVIGVGTCGALQPEIDCGDMIVAESARVGDGLCPYYRYQTGETVPADTGLSASLSGFLNRRGLKVHSGPIHTTGAAFRETEEIIDVWTADGMLGVELETSSLFALAKFVGVKATALHLVTDSPVRREIADVLRGPRRKAMVDGLIDFLKSPELP